MNISKQLQTQREIDETNEKLRQVHSMLSYYAAENKRNAVAIEAYEMLRLQTLEDLAALGEISGNFS